MHFCQRQGAGTAQGIEGLTPSGFFAGIGESEIILEEITELHLHSSKTIHCTVDASLYLRFIYHPSIQ